MGIIGWILFGLVVGIVAKFLMPGRDPGGFIITGALGVVGALLAARGESHHESKSNSAGLAARA